MRNLLARTCAIHRPVLVGAALVVSAVNVAAQPSPEPSAPTAPDPLVAEGQQLAASGEYSRAIAKFKESDAQKPTAEKACLIALAYTRRELWSQAELFFARCAARAGGGDSLPTWANDAKQVLQQKLAATDASAVTFVVDPASLDAQIALTGFPADETFGPQTVHLAPGTYEVTAHVPGKTDAHEHIIVAPHAPQTVTLNVVTPPPLPAPAPVGPAEHGRGMATSTKIWIGAGALAVVGIGMHIGMGVEHGKLSDAQDSSAWDDHDGTYRGLRIGTIAFYGAAVVTGVVGYVVYRGESRERLSVAALPTDGGAFVSLSWTR
ncbi:MAG TPA: hypothetical protein VGM90_25310 [Kofleriaceae bacterium]|jgi:hypothetical protein